MKTNGVDVAILFKNELHPVHAGFADTIGADRIQLPTVESDTISGTVVEDLIGMLQRIRSVPEIYDVYISEDVAGLYAASYLTARGDALNVHLAADHRVFGLDSYNISLKNKHTVAKLADRALDVAIIHRLLRHQVDGVIAVSGFMSKKIKTVAPGLPVRVVTPYIEAELYERLSEVTPALDAEHVLFVGKNRTHKGVDLLCEAWPLVRERHPAATLELVGREHTEHSIEGVTVSGYVEDIVDAYKNAALYVHPARFEAFGVSVIEAMRAGVPAVTTTNCGVTPYLAAVDPSLCCRPEPEEIADCICAYLNRNEADRQDLSCAVERTALSFDSDRARHAFAEQFYRLLSDVGNRRRSWRPLGRKRT